jgi:hypothetical protein
MPPEDTTFRQTWKNEFSEIRRKRYGKSRKPIPVKLRGACSHCPGVNHLETGDETIESPFALELASARHKAIIKEKMSKGIREAHEER